MHHWCHPWLRHCVILAVGLIFKRKNLPANSRLTEDTVFNMSKQDQQRFVTEAENWYDRPTVAAPTRVRAATYVNKCVGGVANHLMFAAVLIADVGQVQSAHHHHIQYITISTQTATLLLRRVRLTGPIFKLSTHNAQNHALFVHSVISLI